MGGRGPAGPAPADRAVPVLAGRGGGRGGFRICTGVLRCARGRGGCLRDQNTPHSTAGARAGGGTCRRGLRRGDFPPDGGPVVASGQVGRCPDSLIVSLIAFAKGSPPSVE